MMEDDAVSDAGSVQGVAGLGGLVGGIGGIGAGSVKGAVGVAAGTTTTSAAPSAGTASATATGVAATAAAAASTATATDNKSEFCASCDWSESRPGFVSHDTAAQTTYATTHHPIRPELYSTIRQACVRSLSCEVCPGREGPLLFGNADAGYTFSYAFFLKDHQARGFQRWYSVILVMTDYLHLISCWTFLVAQIKALVQDLQKRVRLDDYCRYFFVFLFFCFVV